jgi:hypothetical protein
MLARIGYPMRRKALAACLTFMLPTVAAANCDEGVASTVICAEQETLLEVLVEANSDGPNAASALSAELSVSVVEARAACRDGRVDEAVALYDRVIAGLNSVGNQRNK